MSAGTYNIVTKQGVPFHLTVTYDDSNNDAIIVDGPVVAQVRTQQRKDSDLVLQLSSADSSIIVNQNEISLVADASTMDLIDPGQYYYELRAEIGGEPDDIIEGQFIVKPGVIDE